MRKLQRRLLLNLCLFLVSSSTFIQSVYLVCYTHSRCLRDTVALQPVKNWKTPYRSLWPVRDKSSVHTASWNTFLLRNTEEFQHSCGQSTSILPVICHPRGRLWTVFNLVKSQLNIKISSTIQVRNQMQPTPIRPLFSSLTFPTNISCS